MSTSLIFKSLTVSAFMVSSDLDYERIGKELWEPKVKIRNEKKEKLDLCAKKKIICI